jgi:hypothetical protein
MRLSLSRNSLKIFVAFVATLVGFRCSTLNQNVLFRDAAKAAGVSIRNDQIITRTSGDQTFTIAPITTWEYMPATAFGKGVDIAYVYSSTAIGDIPQGYYTLRTIGNVVSVGASPATIQFMDRNGAMAGKLTATLDVGSLTIPAVASTRKIFVTITDQSQSPPSMTSSGIPNGPQRVRLCCPNGVCVVFFV